MWGQRPHCASVGADLGTPPRMWGQRGERVSRVCFGRNTPTYVGTTIHRNGRVIRMAEHPHVCGDNATRDSSLVSYGGTPPRMWGQPSWATYSNYGHRNTPTYVGTTTAPSQPAGRGLEHPHVCGDNGQHRGDGSQRGGTPPRMWGQLLCVIG